MGFFSRIRVSPQALAGIARQGLGDADTFGRQQLTRLEGLSVSGAIDNSACQAALESFHNAWRNDLFVACNSYVTLLDNLHGAARGYARADQSAIRPG